MSTHNATNFVIRQAILDCYVTAVNSEPRKHAQVPQPKSGALRFGTRWFAIKVTSGDILSSYSRHLSGFPVTYPISKDANPLRKFSMRHAQNQDDPGVLGSMKTSLFLPYPSWISPHTRLSSGWQPIREYFKSYLRVSGTYLALNHYLREFTGQV